jgi:arylformamidase
MTNEKPPAKASGELEPGRMLDLTLPLGLETLPWPGDPALAIQRLTSLEAGESALTHAVSLSLHLGTHLDAPRHVLPGGAGIGDLPPDLFLGPAWVADLSGMAGNTQTGTGPDAGRNRTQGAGRSEAQALDKNQRPAPVTPEELEAAGIPAPCPRLLIRTGLDRRPGVFPLEFRALSPEAARWCLDRGVRLLGLDTPSPDPEDSPDLPAHRILLGAGAPLLENLDLSGVAAGEYTLACLPLRLEGLEASPVRAVIWPR